MQGINLKQTVPYSCSYGTRILVVDAPMGHRVYSCTIYKRGHHYTKHAIIGPATAAAIPPAAASCEPPYLTAAVQSVCADSVSLPP